MVNLDLEFDESIVLQATEVERYGIKEQSLDEMVLTNKNIICVYSKSIRLFSKPETVIEKIPLSTIKVVGGRPQAISYDNDDYGLGLQVLFISGHREHFLFYDEKKELYQWEKAIAKVITGEDVTINNSKVAPTKEEQIAENIGKVFTGVSAGLFSAFKGAVDTVKQTVSEITSETTGTPSDAAFSSKKAEKPIDETSADTVVETPVVGTPVTETEPEPQKAKKFIYCSNCGEKLLCGSKFCNNCGTPTGSTQVQKDEDETPPTIETQVEESEIEDKDEPITERQTVYEGKLYKCPNCGEVLKSFVTNCPTCGHEIRGVKTCSPVETLAKKVGKATSLDERIELIANFYIPNTKEDIYDFFILAVSNLEDKWYDTDDAWRAKLEQAYHKARLSFGSTPEFEYLEMLYKKTRKEVDRRERGVAAIFRRNKIASITALLIGGGILMLVIGIILYASTSAKENFDTSWGGLMFAILGINFIIAPAWVLEEIEEKENKKKRRGTARENSTVRAIGKDSGDFHMKNFDDMAEFLKDRGFKNVETKPERKGLLDTEGAIKSISVAGNTEFSEYDEFDVNTRIIIRYYSRKY